VAGDPAPPAIEFSQFIAQVTGTVNCISKTMRTCGSLSACMVSNPATNVLVKFTQAGQSEPKCP